MSLEIPLENYKFNLITNPCDKYQFGEIFSPLNLIQDMFKMLPDKSFEDPNKKWLDPGSGLGNFSIVLFHKLMNGLENIIPDTNKRHEHIITKMMYMVEIKSSNVIKLREIFGPNANIIEGDYTTVSITNDFDFIIGNPPYNSSGIKKVPTNSKKDKKNDGRTVWNLFVKKSVSLLKPNGFLLFIIPSIWMKPDKAKMYNFMTERKLEKIKCLTNTETNKVFNGEAQTPTCIVLLKNCIKDGFTDLFDKNRDTYIHYKLHPLKPIPIFGSSLIQKLNKYVKKCGPLIVKKTNMPPIGVSISPNLSNEHIFKNIKTCLIASHDIIAHAVPEHENLYYPNIIINYSNQELAFSGKIKLVLAHKMYGFPFLDYTGEYGISNRDNYVITDRSVKELEKLRDFLATKTALYIFESARYRMKYLEKYAFEYIPDITKLEDFPDEINDQTIAEYFHFDQHDINYIQTLHRKSYSFSPLIKN